MDISPVGYVIFDFQSVGADLELVARRHHPPGPEDLDVEQADQADVLGLVGDIVDGKLDPGLVFDLVGDVGGGEFNLTGNVVGSKFGHLSANGNGKETIVSALARNSDTDAPRGDRSGDEDFGGRGGQVIICSGVAMAQSIFIQALV